MTLKRSGAGNTLSLPPALLVWLFCMVFCDTLCETLVFPFLSYIFLHLVHSSAIPLVKCIIVTVWGSQGNSLSGFTDIFIFVSYLLIRTWQYTQGVLCAICRIDLEKVVEISAQGLSVRS